MITRIVLAAALVSAAGLHSFERAQPLPDGPRAGAAWVDITPLPGLPTGGHGLAGAKARGYWNRLRVTAFYFEDANGVGAALVSCDLFAVPTQFHQAVASHFTAGNPTNRTRVVLPLERVLIAATHTHHGLANYLSSAAYNKWGGKKKGYNEPLRDFLVARVIEAIELAIVDARSTEEVVIDAIIGQLDATVLRNRSPDVFMQGAESGPLLDLLGAGLPSDAAACQSARLHDEPADYWALDGCPRLRAVNRNVTVLRLRRVGRIDMKRVEGIRANRGGS